VGAGYIPQHWLRTNDKVSSPDVLICFDTETRWETGERSEYHAGRCWALSRTLRHDMEPDMPRQWKCSGTDFDNLAALVNDWTGRVKESWCFAHNLGFDLAVTALPVRLDRYGWQVADFWLGDESTWIILKKDKSKLILTDSWSWLHASLDQVARTMRRRKLTLPQNDTNDAYWLARCTDDVDILTKALVTLMDWWDRNELGKWGITGSSCGWAAARHKMKPKSLVVGPDRDRSAFERRAIYGGRREAFYVGPVAECFTSDYDFVAAYPTTVANVPIPKRAGRHFESLSTDSAILRAQHTGIIAEVTVTTEVPIVPCRIKGEVWWPIGKFRTVLCQPEIILAMESGAKIEIGSGWAYALGTGLRRWAQWCLQIQNDCSGATPELAKMVAKGWGRSVIGRFAQRNSEELFRRPATNHGWKLEHGRDQRSGAPLDIVTMGGEERWLLRDQDGRDTFPAIFAWVESFTRAGLSRAITSRREGTVLQCDTDGWLERERSTRRPDPLPRVPWPFMVRRKGRYERTRIAGATQLWLDQERRLAGVGRLATAGPGQQFEWWDWPGLRWQLEHSETGTYQRTRRTAVLRGDSCKRWILADGTTLPVAVMVGSDGNNRLCGFLSSYLWQQEIGLGPVQHRALRALSDK
jgi:hypothetical protein